MLRSILVFVLVLVVLNVFFRIFDIPIQISIIGSLLLSFLVGGIMELLRRRSV